MDEREQETVIEDLVEGVKETDLSRFCDLYRSFGIECIINTRGDEQYIILSEGDYRDRHNEYTTSEKFDGYFDFYTKIVFDAEGKFIRQGFWE